MTFITCKQVKFNFTDKYKAQHASWHILALVSLADGRPFFVTIMGGLQQ